MRQTKGGVRVNSITDKFLETLAGWKGKFAGAYSVRENGRCAEMHSTPFVAITPKSDLPGLDIHILAGCRGEEVAIPACVTEGGIDDLVYNDFYVGVGAEVTIVAGCGVHTENGEPARHSGIHRFFLEPGAKVRYVEKHLGNGDAAPRTIDPETVIELGEGAQMEMDTAQLGGVDHADRKTKAVLGAGARLVIRERLLTEGQQQARSDFVVQMNGEGAAVDLVSRSVARGDSRQSYRSQITGNAPCTGHSECDALVADNAKVDAAPMLSANHPDAALIHEAAIGKIAGEQIMKLRTLGLTQEEAEAEIVRGFLE